MNKFQLLLALLANLSLDHRVMAQPTSKTCGCLDKIGALAIFAKTMEMVTDIREAIGAVLDAADEIDVQPYFKSYIVYVTTRDK